LETTSQNAAPPSFSTGRFVTPDKVLIHRSFGRLPNRLQELLSLKSLAIFLEARFMSIEPEQSRSMTADECEELAALLLEHAAELPPGQKQGEILKLVFGYRDLAKMKRLVLQNVS
jgi:hypothetical protein